jgi:hypothetical protein
MADQDDGDDQDPETPPLARRGEVVDEEVVNEEGATGRRWGIALVGMVAGAVLAVAGIVLDRSYLVYLGAVIFALFGFIAAGVSRGWFNVPGIGGGGGSFPRKRLRRTSQGGQILGLPKQGKRPPKGPDDLSQP